MAEWSFDLEGMIAEIVRTRGRTEASVIAELDAAAMRAATRVLGDATPIEVQCGRDVLFAQVLRIVEVVSDGHREVSELTAHSFRGKLGSAEQDGVLYVPIYYTANPDEREEIERHQALAASVPLPLHAGDLWEALTAELNAVFCGYFPPPVFPAGSLGALLTSGGTWTAGLAAKSGDLELVVERAFLDYYRLRTSGGWIDYGFETVVRHGGLEVFRGVRQFDTTGSKQLGTGAKAPRLETLARGDNEGSVSIWASLPATAAARDGFCAALEKIVAGLATGSSMNGYRQSDDLLVAAIDPPVANGLWAWMQKALPRLLANHAHETEHDGVRVRFEIVEVHPPAVGLVSFGDAHVGIVTRSTASETSGDAEVMLCGSATPDALALRAPRDDERADLERIVATYRDWLDVHLDHHVANRGLDGLDESDYLDAFDGHFALAELLVQRVQWGPPGEPPVPPFDSEALARAGAALEPVDPGDDDSCFAAFSIAGWQIRLHDDPGGGPFGSECAITLVAPEGGEPVQVLMVDAWNAATRHVVDGDAFAFRRFASWLRGAILAGDHDATIELGGDELALSDWLLFGLPDTGDRFLVDWRAQWHVVSANRAIASFASIYAFSAAFVEQLRDRDIPLWRRFLREVIDSRFG